MAAPIRPTPKSQIVVGSEMVLMEKLSGNPLPRVERPELFEIEPVLLDGGSGRSLDLHTAEDPVRAR